ncbi:hypothetical protein VitviT2T_016965 [Vitis vinifera]|uniref:Tetratricopeptide repeat protein 1 n=1 Tax=Vitis vinifera TaxID=29760 RepID=A0ABY9CTI7_VITVI|eukprot:XP_002272630.1 PREDICTED: tetratricopeptide repeat protein 1 [Vitis vinifera]
MVVIEPAIESEETNLNPKQASSSTTTPPATSAESAKDASDGFETASEGEPETDDEESDGGAGDEQQQQQVSSCEDALNDDQLKEKALAQANDAKMEGNKLFGAGQYQEALSQYELALQVAPEMPSSVEIRSICHANQAICFLKLEKIEDAIKECTKALELNPTYMKALTRRAEAHEKLEHFEEALADTKKILELDPSNSQARRAIPRLEQLAKEKQEKLKEEMIGKLKDMGNSLLGRFGMSVDNFKAVKDPETGQYSISFQR